MRQLVGARQWLLGTACKHTKESLIMWQAAAAAEMACSPCIQRDGERDRCRCRASRLRLRGSRAPRRSRLRLRLPRRDRPLLRLRLLRRNRPLLRLRLRRWEERRRSRLWLRLLLRLRWRRLLLLRLRCLLLLRLRLRLRWRLWPSLLRLRRSLQRRQQQPNRTFHDIPYHRLVGPAAQPPSCPS
jgi:hypothetical protein